jgi:hypothetical protein
MPDYDAGFKIVAREAGRDLAALGGVTCDEWAPITGEVHAAERLADRAFRARRGSEEFVVYMEPTRAGTRRPRGACSPKAACSPSANDCRA